MSFGGRLEGYLVKISERLDFNLTDRDRRNKSAARLICIITEDWGLGSEERNISDEDRTDWQTIPFEALTGNNESLMRLTIKPTFSQNWKKNIKVATVHYKRKKEYKNDYLYLH